MGKILLVCLLFLMSTNSSYAWFGFPTPKPTATPVIKAELKPDPQVNPAFDKLFSEVSKCSGMAFKKPYTILTGEPLALAHKKIIMNYTEAIKLFRLHCQLKPCGK